jgi:hypothetical protein
VLKVLKVHKESKVLKELQSKVLEDLRVSKAFKVLKVLKVLKVHKESKVLKELQSRVLKAFKELQFKVLEVPKVLKVFKDFQFKVLLELLLLLLDQFLQKQPVLDQQL